MSTTQALTVGETAIRQHDGLHSLNDLHQASGADDKHHPTFFLRLDTTQALIQEIQCANQCADMHSTAINTINGGKHRGTYACKEVVIAYAAWISPAFQINYPAASYGVLTAKAEKLAPQAAGNLTQRD